MTTKVMGRLLAAAATCALALGGIALAATPAQAEVASGGYSVNDNDCCNH
ncbi:hypothetical protein GCM10009853_030630 [Glycomyces scopariae]|uniref:Uncharacterized protein n=1 Tax=Glycomyces sambucus TaxID=380244 RepID=A0A1G9G362_9ACTN|nr:hypothetical protein [Glycomyces sambucus]SDK95066.1 hypothetical protein SAMN05216298_2183 [Glycomyces sambucus]